MPDDNRTAVETRTRGDLARPGSTHRTILNALLAASRGSYVVVLTATASGTQSVLARLSRVVGAEGVDVEFGPCRLTYPGGGVVEVMPSDAYQPGRRRVDALLTDPA